VQLVSAFKAAYYNMLEALVRPSSHQEGVYTGVVDASIVESQPMPGLISPLVYPELMPGFDRCTQ